MSNHTVVRKFVFNHPFAVFYFVTGYMILFSIWWGYLLYQKNEISYIEKVELNKILFDKTKSEIDYTATAEYAELNKKYDAQKRMILSEGLVFLVLLLIGFWQVRRILAKEIAIHNQQTNFLLSITHELKTPISSLKLALQTIQNRELEKEMRQKFIQNSLSDVDRLHNLVENILFAAKIETNQHGMVAQDTNLSEITSQAVKQFQTLHPHFLFITAITENIFLFTDPVGYTSVVYNLIENAIKYSSEAGKVEVSLFQRNNEITLIIADNGIGISDNEKQQVFQKFYRVGDENIRKTKGTGLGLFIVKRYVEISNAKLIVTDNRPQGTKFEITFY